MKIKIVRVPKGLKWVLVDYATVYKKCIRIFLLGRYIDIPIRP